MPRIRSVKPEFFDSPGTSAASPWARLLFIAMWCWADDWGIGDANPRRLLGFAFPEDEDPTVTPRNFPGIAGEVAEAYGVVWYEAQGRQWFAIPSWEKHQRTDKRSAKRNPTPDQAERLIYTQSRDIPRNPTESHGDAPYGTGEQGNRGTGERSTCSPPAASSVRASRFDEFWTLYPRKVGKKKAETKYAVAAKRVDEQTIIDGARRLAEDPNLPEQQFIPHPTTWLERDGWDDEPYMPRTTGRPLDRQAEILRRERDWARQADAAEEQQLRLIEGNPA